MLAFRPGRAGRFAQDAGSFDSDKKYAVIGRVALSPGAFHFVAGKNRVHAINLALATTEKTASHFARVFCAEERSLSRVLFQKNSQRCLGFARHDKGTSGTGSPTPAQAFSFNSDVPPRRRKLQRGGDKYFCQAVADL